MDRDRAAGRLVRPAAGRRAGEEGIGQRCWSHAVGRFTARYAATVVVDRLVRPLHHLPPTAVRHLPGAVVGYLMPSRYCPSDKLEGFVRSEFAGLSGGPLAAALAEWTARSLRYSSNGSTGTTTALDTFASREGCVAITPICSSRWPGPRRSRRAASPPMRPT